MKQTAVVVFPGRGAYGHKDLGKFGMHHGSRGSLIRRFDEQRRALSQILISELDNSESFSEEENSREEEGHSGRGGHAVAARRARVAANSIVLLRASRTVGRGDGVEGESTRLTVLVRPPAPKVCVMFLVVLPQEARENRPDTLSKKTKLPRVRVEVAHVVEHDRGEDVDHAEGVLDGQRRAEEEHAQQSG